MRVHLLILLTSIAYAMGSTGGNCPANKAAENDSYALQPADHSGDYLYLAGIMDVHHMGVEEDSCGLFRRRGWQGMEAFLWAVSTFKDRYPNALKDISLGAIAFDPCGSGRNILKYASSIAECKEGYGPEGSFIDPKRIMGYVGPCRSGEAEHIWRDFKNRSMPLVSHSATKTTLSQIPSFLRTPPSDIEQIHAMIAFAKKMDWKSIQTVTSDNSFGTGGFNAFNDLIKDEDICLVNNQVIPTRNPTERNLDKIIQGLQEYPDTKGVIFFCNDNWITLVLEAAKRAGVKGEFYWLAWAAWGNSEEVVQGVEEYALGALTLTYNSDVNGLEEFMTDLRSMTSSTRPQDPWFSEAEAENDISTLEMDVWTPYAILAVDSLLNGVERARAKSCPTSGLCDAFLNSPTMLNSVHQSLLEGDDPVKFDPETGDSFSGKHDVYNYKKNKEECDGKDTCYIKVGEYRSGDADVDFERPVVFYDENGDVEFDPISTCKMCMECVESGATVVTVGILMWLPLLLWLLQG